MAIAADRYFVPPYVGRRGWVALLKHELITLVSQGVPGAVGLALRKTLYPSLLGACGPGVIFGQNVVLRQPAKIRIGQNVVHPKFGSGVIIDAEGQGNDARVQVNFGAQGVKWLAVSVAKLQAASASAAAAGPHGSYGIGFGGLDVKAALFWAFVGVPLLWGVWKTLESAVKIF